MSFAIKLNALRKKRGLGLDELSSISGIPKGTLSKISAGITQNPSLDTVKALAMALECSLDDFDDSTKLSRAPNLTEAGQRIGRAYEKATPPVQRTVEVALEPYMEITEDPPDNIIHVDFSPFDHSEQYTSAGKGVFLSDETMITIHVRTDALPRDYNRYPERYFGVPVRGNSMEPKFHDEDILIVCKEPVNVGEIGIFTMEGEGYVKMLGCGVLHSLNPEFEDVPMTEDILCNGKVVGVLDPKDICKE